MENNFGKIRFSLVLIIILAGIVLCGDLSYIFYKTNFLETFQPSFCSVSELIDCDGLAQTDYTLTLGVPNAFWGLFTYLIFLMLLFVDKIQAKFPNSIFKVFKNPRSYMTTIGLLIFTCSIILACVTYFDLHKICILCIGTYFVDLLIALICCTKIFFFYDIKVTIIDFITGAKEYFLLFLIILIASCSALYYLNDSYIMSPKLKKQKEQKEFFEAKSNKYAIKGNLLGHENAPVVINIYSDFNCPFCKVSNIMIHKIAKKENILVNEFNFPLDKTCNTAIGGTLGGHETSCLCAKYALAAKKQNNFWGVANILFYLDDKSEENIVEQIKKSNLKIDIDKLKSDANSPSVAKELSDEIYHATTLELNGTPAFEINGVLYIGGMPYEELVEKIKTEQKRAENNKK